MINDSCKSYLVAAGVLSSLVSGGAQASFMPPKTGLYAACKAHQSKMVRVWCPLGGSDRIEDVKKNGLSLPTGSSFALTPPGPKYIGFDVDPELAKVRNRCLKYVHESGYRASEQTLLKYMERRARTEEMRKNASCAVVQHPISGEPCCAYVSNIGWRSFISGAFGDRETFLYEPVLYDGDHYVDCTCYDSELIINKHIDPKDLHFYDEQGNETK